VPPGTGDHLNSPNSTSKPICPPRRQHKPLRSVRHVEMEDDARATHVRRDKTRGECLREEEPLGEEPPVDGPLVEELSGEIECRGEVRSGEVRVLEGEEERGWEKYLVCVCEQGARYELWTETGTVHTCTATIVRTPSRVPTRPRYWKRRHSRPGRNRRMFILTPRARLRNQHGAGRCSLIRRTA
jgi:hypothetical protein